MPLVGASPWVRIKSRQRATRALVLRWVPYSNTSQILTAFTRDFGILALLAKGSLRLPRASSSFGGPFEVAGWYDVVVRHRSGDVDLVTEARLVEGFSHLRKDLGSYLEASFALELLSRGFRPADPHPEVLRGALSFLKLLEVREAHLALRIHLVASVLRESGVEPDWSRCAECERELQGQPAELRLPSGLVCSRCRDASDRPVAEDAVDHLRRSRDVPWGKLAGLSLDKGVLLRAWALLGEILLFHLEAAPRTLRFLGGRSR